MPFEKGKSGNPNGRPKKTQEQIDFEEKCRLWASKYAIERLIRAADSEVIKESLAGTQEIINRAFGKAVETSIIEANVTSEVGSSVDDISKEIAAFIPGTAGASGSNNIEVKVDAGQ